MRRAAVILMAIGLCACSSISVESDWDTSVDFSTFQTFALIDNPESTINRLVDERIRNAISTDLESKGLSQLDDYDDADLAIGYEVTTEQRATYHTIHSGWGASGFRTSNVRIGASVGTSQTVRNDFTVGTLVIAVFRVEDKTLIWEGSGSDTVSPSRGPEESTQKINEAVEKILGGFPPGV
ncbi:MAG: DUF4136 domain-containing protein [Betaproteobacteria bacterium]|nr:MAG: DUF4136 domain-containing protein [Betaproteobacteria bacterium]